MRGEFKGFFVIKQIEKPWLCSVLLKRTQDSVRARKKCSEVHETWSSVSPHFLNVSQQNMEQLGLLYLLNRESKRQGTRGNEERDSHFTLASRLPPLAWILLLTGYLHQSNYLCCRWVLFSEQQLADKMRPLGLNWAWNLASEVCIVEFHVLGLNAHVGWLTLAHEMTNLKRNIFCKNTFV